MTPRDPHAPHTPLLPDHGAAALHRLVPVLCEDAIFALAAGGGDATGALEGLGRRRIDAYNATVQGGPIARMSEQFDAWTIQLVRAIAPVSPPRWLPMMDVVRERVTLEIGARGLRSLFSSKPSDKDVARVKKLGTLAVRYLRAVLAGDGPLDPNETTSIDAVIGALGLPDTDAQALSAEAPIPPEMFEVYGEFEPAVARALVRGAWLAAASHTLDPREEHAVRVVAQKLGVRAEEAEASRAEAQLHVEALRQAGLAAVDGIRFVLSDRTPGFAVTLAAHVCALMLPRRYRDEALAHVAHGAPVTLARRYPTLVTEARVAVLGIAWAAALLEDPSVSRRALVGARWERFAADIGEDGERGRALVDSWILETLAAVARTVK